MVRTVTKMSVINKKSKNQGLIRYFYSSIISLWIYIGQNN